jgi:MoxR-like ATPase
MRRYDTGHLRAAEISPPRSLAIRCSCPDPQGDSGADKTSICSNVVAGHRSLSLQSGRTKKQLLSELIARIRTLRPALPHVEQLVWFASPRNDQALLSPTAASRAVSYACDAVARRGC